MGVWECGSVGVQRLNNNGKAVEVEERSDKIRQVEMNKVNEDHARRGRERDCKAVEATWNLEPGT